MTKTLLLFLLTTMLCFGEKWSHKATGDVKWMRVSEAGTLYYGTDDGIFAVDPATGNTTWKRDEFKKIPESDVEELPGTPLLFIASNNGTFAKSGWVVAIDLLTGATVWETEKVKGSVVGMIPVYSKDMILMLTVPQPTLHAKITVNALGIFDGKLAWQTEMDEKADMFPAEKSSKFFPKFDISAHAKPTIDGDSVYLAYAGVHKLDLNTGKLLWKSPYDVTEKAFKQANASPLVAGPLVYTSAKGVVRAFDKETGAAKWTSADFGSGVPELAYANDILFARMGGTFYEMYKREYQLKKPLGVIALNPASGQVKWKYDKAKDSLTNMALLEKEKIVLVADTKNLIGLAMDGSESFLTPLEFKVKSSGLGKAAKIGFGALRGGAIGLTKAAMQGGPTDPPLVVVHQGDGKLVVRATQHILQFDAATRSVAWATELEAPGNSMLTKIAMGAAFAMMYAAETGHAMNTQLGTSENSGANKNRRQMIDGWESVVSKRFSKTNTKGNFTYMLTDIKLEGEKGPGIAGVNMTTGLVERKIIFGDKEPEYTVDEVGGVVYKKHKKGNEIQAIDIQ